MVALGDVCDINIGRTPSRSRSEYWGEGEPWLSISDMNQGRSISATKEQVTDIAVKEAVAKPVDPGTVLLSFKLSIGKVGIAQRMMYTNEAIASLPIRRGVALEPDFLAWSLQNLNLAVTATSNRAAMGATLNKASLAHLQVPLPPIAEQRRIAAILDHTDRLVSLRRQALAAMEDLRSALFGHHFGAPDTWAERWRMGSIGDITEEARYGTSAKAGPTGSYAVLRMGNITYQGRLDLADLKYMDLADKDVARYTVRRGDVLFNRTNSADLVGKTAVVASDRELAYAGYLVRLRLTEGNEPEFVSGYLNSRHGKATLRGMCKSIVGQANINARELQAIHIPIPPPETQAAYALHLQAVEVRAESDRRNLADLADLSASLQSRAFSGRL